MSKKLGLIALSVVLAATMSACASNKDNNTASSPSNDDASNSSASPSAAESAAPSPENLEPIELKVFTNAPDRMTGQGKAEDHIYAEYMKLHPNVTIKVEALATEQYGQKLKIYNASNQLPDMFSVWGNNSSLTPLISNDALAELSWDDFKDSGFVDGAFDGFTKNGKIYGVPGFMDFWFIYYNKKIFADNGLEVPQTQGELMEIVEKLKAKDIVPIAMQGRAAWSSVMWYDTVLARQTGGFDLTKDIFAGKGTYKGSEVVQAATDIQSMIKAGIFGDGFLNQDYGTARNLFGQGKAAMFMMGQWEMSMPTDTNFPPEVRDNIGAFAFPANEKGKGTQAELNVWYGGGLAVSNKSKNREAAKDLIKFFFQPENWPKFVWQNGITFPAQKYDAFLTGQETPVQNDITNILKNATTFSGYLTDQLTTPSMSKEFQNLIQQLEAMKVTPEQFAESMDEIVAKSNAEQAEMSQ
ncbi:ABC transporter substrate-binding protein [Paenibacillus sp. strain BS8-2]